jgi:sporulation protein YlmC with PRC-barrel domain
VNWQNRIIETSLKRIGLVSVISFAIVNEEIHLQEDIFNIKAIELGKLRKIRIRHDNTGVSGEIHTIGRRERMLMSRWDLRGISIEWKSLILKQTKCM